MDRARARRADTYSHLARELCMGASHESRHFLMPGLNKVDPVLGAVQSAHDPVDTVTGIPINAFYAPGDETFDNKVANLLCHILRISLAAKNTMPYRRHGFFCGLFINQINMEQSAI